MGYGIAEFEERVKGICDRWYVKGGNLLKVSGSQCQPIIRTLQVWERPYEEGEGFRGDTLILEIGDEEEYQKTGQYSTPNPNHLQSLRRGHWNRVRAQQVEEIRKMNRQNHIRELRHQHQLEHENRMFAIGNRDVFRKASQQMGFSKVSSRDFGPKKMMFNQGV